MDRNILETMLRKTEEKTIVSLLVDEPSGSIHTPPYLTVGMRF